MAIVRWGPTRDLYQMERDIRRMFRNLESGSDEPASMAVWAPPVDIYETDNEVVVRAELPGMDQKDIDIRIENNALTIKGERRMDQMSKKTTTTELNPHTGPLLDPSPFPPPWMKKT